jgi:hypothetical protein
MEVTMIPVGTEEERRRAWRQFVRVFARLIKQQILEERMMKSGFPPEAALDDRSTEPS